MRASIRVVLAGALFALAGCSSQPIYTAPADLAQVPPETVAQTPERFGDRSVIWGGRVVSVDNLPNHTEIEILGYPLDHGQRPQPDQPAGGRFIAVMSGYVEKLDYPAGALVTLRGRIAGTRAGKVGEAPYVFPLVKVEAIHLWTAEELRSNRPSIGIGLGVGIGVH